MSHSGREGLRGISTPAIKTCMSKTEEVRRGNMKLKQREG